MNPSDHLPHIDLADEMQEVYLHRFLFKLALASVAIFIPLYILELGAGLPTVLTFFAVYYAAFIAVAPVAALIVARIGYKHTSLAAAPVVLLFYLGLRGLAAPGPMLHVLAAVGGAGIVTYWIGMNAEMARASHDNRRESETGIFFAMASLAAVAAPFLGGVVLAAQGFELLFAIAAGLVGLSFLPLLRSREHYSGMDLSWHDFLDGRSLGADIATFVAQGAASIGRKVFWPAYLAVIITGSVNIGGAGSLLALGSTAASFLVGRVTTRANNGRVLLVGGAVTAAAFLAMSIAATPGAAFLVSFATGVAYFTVSIPVYTRVMRRAEREDILEYITVRELGLATGRILVLLLAAVAVAALPLAAAFRAMFVLAAVAILLAAVLGRGIPQ